MQKIRIPWWQPFCGKEEIRNLMKVIDINFLNDGEFTREFERSFARLCGVKYAVGVTSGTASLALALMACDITFGDEVIVPDFTFIGTANAVSLTGAKPVFVDINRKDLNIDPKKIENKINSKTRAIIPVHVNGRMAQMPKINKLARKYGLVVIEDAAEAIGSRFNGKALGTFSQAGCFSFAPTKIITMGQGGMIVTQDKKMYIRLRELKDQGRPERGTGGADIHVSIGYNFKLTNLQAAVGLAQLRRLESRLRHIREIHAIYNKYLKDVEEIKIIPIAIKKGLSPQWIDALAKNRDELANYLSRNGIDTRNFWLPNHTQKPYIHRGDYKETIYVSSHGLWLPSSFNLTQKAVNFICRKIKEFYSLKIKGL